MRMVVAPRSRISAAVFAKASSSSRRSSASGCSRISWRKREPGSPGATAGSADDTRASLDEYTLDLEFLRQDHDVGGRSDAEPPHRREAEHTGGHLRGRTDGVLERHPQRLEVADRLDHRERAPGGRPGRPAGDAVADLDVEGADAVWAVVDTSPRDGVRDQREPSLRSLPDHRGGNGSDVDPVEDQLNDDVGSSERRT